MISVLDAKVFDFCTRFSHWLQRTTGLTNFFVAKSGVFAATFSTIFTIISYWYPAWGKTALFDVLFSFSMLPYSIYFVEFCNRNEDRLMNGKVLFKDPLSLMTTGNFLRIFLLVNCLLTLTHVFWLPPLRHILKADLLIWGLTTFHYFSRVAPLPPGTSKLRKAIENFSAGFRKQVPIPIT